jgi:hypothetical protein
MSYIRGRYANAACDLMDHLKALNVRADVGYLVRGKDRPLIARVREGDRAMIPTEWAGLKVVIEAETLTPESSTEGRD